MIPEAQLLYASLVRIDQQADLLEGKKRDTDGQHDIGNIETGLKGPVQRFDQECGIFVKRDQSKVENNAKRSKGSTQTLSGPGNYGAGDGMVEQDRDDQQHQVSRNPESVENERGDYQQRFAPAFVVTPDQPVAKQQDQ